MVWYFMDDIENEYEANKNMKNIVLLKMLRNQYSYVWYKYWYIHHCLEITVID